MKEEYYCTECGESWGINNLAECNCGDAFKDTRIARKKITCKAVGCRKKFTPINSFNTACSPKCSIKVMEQKKAKKAKEQKAINKLKLEGIQPRSYFLKKAQAAVNKYIRMRDYGRPCISCGNGMNWHKPGGAVDACHYRSRGSSPHLRFNLLNIHAGCVKCNRFLSGNITDYRIRNLLLYIYYYIGDF